MNAQGAEGKKSGLRRGVAWFLGTVAVIVVALLVIPFVVDLSRFKPQIQQQLSKYVNGELDYQSAQLTLLTGPGIEFDSVSLVNTTGPFAGEALAKADSGDLRISLWPLLRGQVVGRIVLEGPEVQYFFNDQTNNVAALVKTTDGEQKEAPEPSQQPEPTGEPEKPSAAETVVIDTLKIDDAVVRVQEFPQGPQATSITVENLDVMARKLGIGQAMSVDISSRVEINRKPLNIEGPIRLELQPTIEMQGNRFSRATFKGTVDLDPLEVTYAKLFRKRDGDPLHVSFSGQATPSSLAVETLQGNLVHFALSGSGGVEDFETLATNGSVQVKAEELGRLKSVLPSHETLLTEGSIEATASVTGPLASLESVKAKAHVKAAMDGSDLDLSVDVANAKAPVADVKLRSERIDMGALLEPVFAQTGDESPQDTAEDKEPAEGPAEEEKTSGGAKAPAGSGGEKGLSQATKDALRPADIDVDAAIGEMLYGKLAVRDIGVRGSFRDLKGILEEFSLKVFEGTVAADGQVDLAPDLPLAKGSGKISSMNLSPVAGLASESLADGVSGDLTSSLSFQSEGMSKDEILSTLDAEGSYVLAKAQIDVKALDQVLSGEADAYVQSLSVVEAAGGSWKKAERLLDNPAVAKWTKNRGIDVKERMKSLKSVNDISLGKVLGEGKPEKTLKGSFRIEDGTVFFKSQRQSGAGTYRIDGRLLLSDLSLDGDVHWVASESVKKQLQRQSKYASLLFAKDGSFQLSLDLSGTALNPSYALNTKDLRATFQNNAQETVRNEILSELDADKAAREKAKETVKKKLEKAKKDEKTKEAVEKLKDRFGI